MANLFFGRAMLQGKEVKRRRVIDEDEFAEESKPISTNSKRCSAQSRAVVVCR